MRVADGGSVIRVTGRNMLIRADANAEIGIGHIMRCIALAQSWLDAGGDAVFATAMLTPNLEARLWTERMKHVSLVTRPGSPDDARQTVDAARRMDTSTVVVDGYHFGTEYQRIMKNAGLRLLCIDDYGHADYYWADVVINQNTYAHAGFYTDRAPYSRLLLGVRYVLLRREFLRWRGRQRQISKIGRKILVTLGGGDPHNVTATVIEALRQVEIDGLQVVAVVGEHHPLSAAAQSPFRDSRLSIRVITHAENMPALMAWADVVITAGGTTCWESAFMGLPTLVIVTADNQRLSAESLHEKGIVRSLGWWAQCRAQEIASAAESLLYDALERKEIGRLGQQLVDGFGSKRALDVVISNGGCRISRESMGDDS